MDIDQLEQWAHLAVDELQSICDDAQVAEGNPKGEDQLPGIRQLIKEFDEMNAQDWMRALPDNNDHSLLEKL